MNSFHYPCQYNLHSSHLIIIFESIWFWQEIRIFCPLITLKGVWLSQFFNRFLKLLNEMESFFLEQWISNEATQTNAFPVSLKIYPVSTQCTKTQKFNSIIAQNYDNMKLNMKRRKKLVWNNGEWSFHLSNPGCLKTAALLNKP